MPDKDEFSCEITDCPNDADFEGYARKKDFAGLPTGLTILIKVCKDHKSVLIGAEDTGVTNA